MKVRSSGRSLAFVLLLAVPCGASGTVAADDGLNVIAYLADPVDKRDGEGRPAGSIPRAALPPTPAAVLDVQRGAVLVATASGKGVWLDRDDVELDRSGSVRQLCNSLAVASNSDQVTAVKIAMRSSCAKQLAP